MKWVAEIYRHARRWESKKDVTLGSMGEIMLGCCVERNMQYWYMYGTLYEESKLFVGGERGEAFGVRTVLEINV